MGTYTGLIERMTRLQGVNPMTDMDVARSVKAWIDGWPENRVTNWSGHKAIGSFTRRHQPALPEAGRPFTTEGRKELARKALQNFTALHNAQLSD